MINSLPFFNKKNKVQAIQTLLGDIHYEPLKKMQGLGTYFQLYKIRVVLAKGRNKVINSTISWSFDRLKKIIMRI